MVVDYEIAGLRLRVDFENDRLHQAFSPALAHLRAAGQIQPALTLRVAGGRAGAPQAGPAGAVRPRLHATNGSVRHVAYPATGISGWLDAARGEAGWSIPEDREIPVKERAAPFRTVLHWWLAGQGLALVHGGGVGTARGAALLVGRGGSGKSVTAVGCATAGLRFLGDDAVPCGVHPPALYCLYSRATVHARDAARFPGRHSVSSGEGEKVMVDLGDRVAPALPLRAILMPVVTGGTATRIQPMTAAETLRAMAPSSLLNAPGSGESSFLQLTDLVRRVPGFVVELGSEVEEVAAAIRRFMEREEPR
jgi:hypothetical protein